MNWSAFRGLLVVVLAGLATFVVVDAVLQAPLHAPPADQAEGSPPEVASVPRAGDSLAARISAGHVAVGVPVAGSEPLVREVRAGDRVNVLASLADPQNARPVTAIVVRGATVLQQPATDQSLLLDVSAEDALALAHLALSGTRLAYVLWPADGAPPETPPLDETTARAVLGLTVPAPATPASTPASTPAVALKPTPTAMPELIPTPPAPAATSATYTVQTGDTLESVAARLGVDQGALWFANRDQVESGQVQPGTQLAVPTYRGFLYQVQPDDTWDTIGGMFQLPPAMLAQLNEMSPVVPPPAGSLVFVPRSR